MPNCAVATCKNTNKNGKHVKFFRFPKNSDLAKQWAVACNRGNPINLKYATVCSEHFEQNAFEISLKHRLLQYSPKNFRNLKSDAVPTVNLHHSLHVCKKDNSEKKIVTKAKRNKRFKVDKISNRSSTGSVASASETQFVFINLNDIKQEAEEVATLENDLENDNQYARISQHEVSELREQIKLLEIQNGELLRKLEDEKNERKMYEFDLREKIKRLEIQNGELLQKLEDEKIDRKKYERALAYMYSKTYKKNKECR